ncbi:hypothetical protein VTN31DRAFT_1194 [Thermomyces dupontii]|uniref:uncharacterized protein n=1 Tax=Talaromyces thermophilus TaxID=28565 RepID=UPI0037430394
MRVWRRLLNPNLPDLWPFPEATGSAQALRDRNSPRPKSMSLEQTTTTNNAPANVEVDTSFENDSSYGDELLLINPQIALPSPIGPEFANHFEERFDFLNAFRLTALKLL